MGCYDTLVDGTKESQVKTWECDMKTYNPGDTVPDLNGCHTYSIKLQEGGFATIRENVFLRIDEKALCEDVFSKWGGSPEEENPLNLV